MQKNLFTKYFTICVTLILSAILLLGSFLMVFAGQYFRNDKMEMLEQYAAQATGLTMAAYQQNNYLYLDEATLSSVYNVLANVAEVSIFLSDINGKVLLCTDDSIFVDPTMPLSEAVLQEALSGRFEDDARLDGAYRARHYTKAQKIGLPDGRTSGYVFVTASARSLTEFLGRILNIFLLSALTMVVIASIVIYFVTARMVRPLRDMLAATRSFSRGDYTVRVQVNSADEIGQLAQEFNHMAEALARNENMNRSFVANVSHELKTPMTTIAGFVDGILDGTIPQEQHGKYLAVVSVEAKRL